MVGPVGYEPTICGTIYHLPQHRPVGIQTLDIEGSKAAIQADSLQLALFRPRQMCKDS